MKIDYLMFRDLAVGEVFTVTDRRASWLFHGRGAMEKIAISDHPYAKFAGRYLDNRRDNRTYCGVDPGYQVQRVAGPKGACDQCTPSSLP